MALNLNSSPYYDDFDATKNFNRILFKPGVAVQARELTQLQSILSDQIAQLGSFTLKDGAIVSGCEEKLVNVNYIKITDQDFDGEPIQNSDLTNYVGAIVTGGTTGLKAKVLSVKTGDTGSSPDTKVLYIAYTDSGGTTNTNEVLEFAKGETLTVSSDKTDDNGDPLNGNTFVTFNSGSAAVGSRTRYAGVAPHLTLSPGIIYARGNFIRTVEISTFVDDYTPLSDRKIGFLVSETVTTSSDADGATLVDPAQGSFNFNAPGADRLTYSATLAAYSFRDAIPDNFFQYASFEFGKIVRSRIISDPLAEIGNIIAERAYIADGNYLVNGLQTYFREHLNDGNTGGLLPSSQGGLSTKLVAAIRPGSANVAGYPVELRAEKLIPFDKPSASVIEETVTQSTSYGNYIIIDDVCGAWDVDGSDEANGSGIIDLYDTAFDAVTNTTFSGTSVSVGGNKVGVAKIRHISLLSGTPGAAAAQYKLYLYDIKMITGDFASVGGVHYDSGLADGFANIVLNAAGDAQLYETNFNKLLWNLPYSHLKTLQADSSAYDYDFKFTKEFDSNIDTNAVINITSSIANQTFFFGNASPISNALTEANLTLVATSSFTVDGTTYADGEIIPLNGKVSQTSETALTIDLGTSSTVGTVRLYANMQLANTNPIGKSLQTGVYVKIDATTNIDAASGKYSLGIADVHRVTQILATDNSDYETNARNVTRDFIFNNGQKDNLYGLGYIQKRSGSSLDLSTYRYLLVKLDYFSRSPNGPTFACVDSYPVDDTGSSGTIKTEQIPIYQASSGSVFDLKNAIDFRPYIKNTATNSSTVAGATVNPSIFEEIDRPTNGLTNPTPVGQFTTDLEYYLAEAYRIVVTEEGNFRIIKSAPEVKPKTPKAPAKSMTLATGFLPPYPCLSSKSAKFNNRPDLAASINIEKNKRYTMRDIGALEERISNLEYYTSLTLLEKQAGETKILDADGVDRFKNGFIVDSFSGFGVNAVSHQDNNISIDRKKRILRAAFDTSVVGFKAIATDTTVGQTGDMFHVPYFETVYTRQLQASKFRNVVGELLIKNPTTPVVPTPPNTTPYSLVRSKLSVDEGSSVTITLETDNIAAGTLVPYTITGISSDDIDGASLTGNFTVDSAGDAFLTLNITADAETEGTETLTLTLDGKGVSTTVSINDTSTTPAATPVGVGPYIGSMILSPDEDTFFDMHAAPEPYTNNNGEWDNLTTGLLETSEGLTSGWSLEWGAWETVTSTIGAAYPGDNFGVEFDGETQNVDNGLYVPSYGVTWTNEGTIPAQSTTEWDVRNAEYVWTGPEVINIETQVVVEADTFLRPISITGSVDNLMPNTNHIIVMDGVRKGTTRSNANGRASFTIQVNSGEFRTGNLPIQVSNTESISSATSFAQAIFTANHTKNAIITTEATKPAPPSGPIVPEVRSRTTATTVTTTAATDKSTVFTEDTTQTTEIITTNGVIIATSVSIDELDMQDFEVSSSCDGSRSKAIMQRPDGTQYGVEIDDPGCFEYNAYITTKNKAVISGQDETYNTTTKTVTTQQSAVNTAIISDDTEYVDDNHGGTHVTTATFYSDESGTIDTEGAVTDFNFEEGVSLTVGVLNQPTSTAVVTGSYVDTVNDARTDPTLTTVATEAFQFDFNEFDLFCAETGLYGGSFDPLAQTFFVEGMQGGMFITSADIFFRSISSEENNNGITLQIREVINGVPSTEIVPNGKAHLRRSSCFTSTIENDGSVNFASTNFKFNNPVHLKNNTEYALVLVPDADDPGYEVWIGELGGTEVGKTTRITKQAHTGILYTSANNRSWSPHQSEDLMFVLRRAKFDVNTDFVLKTTNKNTDWIKVDHTSWDTTTDSDGRIPTPRFTKGDALHGFTFTIDEGGAGYSSEPTVVFTGGGGSGATATATLTGDAVTAITLTNPGTGFTSTPTISFTGGGSPTTDAEVTARLNRAIYKFFDRGYSVYELEVTDGYFAANDMIGNGTTYVDISSIENKAISAYVLQASTINPEEKGTVTPKIAFTKTGAASANTTYSNARIGSTEELHEEKTIYSYSNEQATYSGNKTALLEFTLRTSSNNVAPMVDLSSLDMLAIVNDINNPSIVEEEVAVGGNARSKYISRQVVLAEGQDAEDLKVYLDSQIPTGAAVEVYAKVMNSADDADFLSEIEWKQLSIDDRPFVATEGLAEYSYKVPAKASGFGLNGSDILEYDVTRINSIPVSTGGSGYSSAPTVKITDEVSLTGTLTATTSSTSVTGSGTAFTTELEVGSVLLNNSGDVAGTVASIETDTALTLTINSLVAITAASAKKQGPGFGATAEAILSGNAVSEIRIINPGRGYTDASVTVTLTGGSPSTEATIGTVTTNTVTYTGFKYFAVKIVHLSSNTAIIPKSSGLRAYALQA